MGLCWEFFLTEASKLVLFCLIRDVALTTFTRVYGLLASILRKDNNAGIFMS